MSECDWNKIVGNSKHRIKTQVCIDVNDDPFDSAVVWASERMADLEKELSEANTAICWLHNEADVYANDFYGNNEGIKGEVDYINHKAAIERATD